MLSLQSKMLNHINENAEAKILKIETHTRHSNPCIRPKNISQLCHYKNNHPQTPRQIVNTPQTSPTPTTTKSHT